MVYQYDACDQISDSCHQQLLWKMSWIDGHTDRGKTVYPPPPSGSGGYNYLIIVLNMYEIFALDVEQLTIQQSILFVLTQYRATNVDFYIIKESQLLLYW